MYNTLPPCCELWLNSETPNCGKGGLNGHARAYKQTDFIFSRIKNRLYGMI